MAVAAHVDDDQTTLVTALRRFQPTKIRAVLSGDESRDVAVPARRHKWERVVEVLDTLAWTRVECLDKSGSLLGVINGQESDDAPADVKALAAREYAFGELLLRAADQAVKRHTEQLQPMLDGYQALAAQQAELLVGLLSRLGAVIEMQHEAATILARGAAAPGAEDVMGQLLLAKLGVLPRQVAAATARGAAPDNGAKP